MSVSISKNKRRGEAEKLDYFICIQFLLIHLVCLLALWTGVSVVAVAVCLALYVVRMFGITAGFHRLLSHRSYRTGRVFQFVLAFLGTTANQKGPLWWSAHHRRHHLYTDTERDLHSPVARTLWQSQVGWFLTRESQATEWKLISNLVKFRELRFLDRYYSLPPALLALATFALGALLERYAPALGTSGWQMLIWGFFISTVLLYHGTFTVNSLAHIFGSRRFQTDDNSRNNLFVALITLGEGWHNNHHHYPSSERQGFYWWEIDVAHYTLRALSLVGIVWDLRTPPADVFAPRIRPATTTGETLETTAT
ncbi:MAG TPA: acyl-CoA desaturase [Pyrinomonadaceae bacterium]|jgi:stearoyl-CoA desaturase (delta-9 desaturase)|nr:acyl-CoA desaturase [Pyrinomonadaceae bacterium]